MKVCPRCQKTYSDDGLNFCLDDGATLEHRQSVGNSIPATVLMNQPPTGQNQQANWTNQNQQFTMQPPAAAKKSRTWLWVVGILGSLMLLCGGGFAGLIYLGANVEKNKQNYNSAYNSNSVFASNKKTGNVKAANTTTNVQTDEDEQEIDLSGWTQEADDSGFAEYQNGDFLMSSKKKGFYYVLTSKGEYKTENAATTVTVRNINEADTNLGFGLVVHSNPLRPLLSDYAFLIDSEDKKYRVVRHTPGDEITVVNWTRSAAIKDGSEENVLEVRDANSMMTFYINGEMVKSVSNAANLTGGVAGLYSGDAVQIAFSDFKINK